MRTTITSLQIIQAAMEESLIIESYYAPEATTFTWVGRPGMFCSAIDLRQNPYIKLFFTGVREFAHNIPPQGRALFTANHTWTKDHVMHLNLDHLTIHARGSHRYSASLSCTYLLGKFTFEFEALQAELFYTNYQGLDPKGDALYTDPQTGAVVDFYRPFGDITTVSSFS